MAILSGFAMTAGSPEVNLPACPQVNLSASPSVELRVAVFNAAIMVWVGK